MRLWRWVNPISTSFLTLSDRCQYRAVPMGLGSTTPAVYAACQIPLRLILRVISRMNMEPVASIGASCGCTGS